MKKLLVITLFLFLWNVSFGTDHYFATAGNDANTGTQASPWKSITKFNSTAAIGGDRFFFNRGDIFYGTLIPKSGSAGNPVIITSYGSGVKPVITGLVDVTSWTNLGANIWESTATISTLLYTNMVVINGVNTAMGRTPNTGTFTYTSHTGTGAGGATSFTSISLATIPCVGSEIAYNAFTYKNNREFITSQSGSTVTFQTTAQDQGIQFDGQPFIIQNDLRTLDVQNEWYYNPSTKRIDIYSVGSPTGVKVSTADSLVFINAKSWITIDSISFTGGGNTGIWMDNVQHITILNCDFNYMGRDGIFDKFTLTSTAIDIENCTINHCNNDGINFYYPQNNTTTIRNNIITNCGLQFGMGGNGRSGTGNCTYAGIGCLGANALIELNKIDSIGNLGIWCFGANGVVQYNTINHGALLLRDNSSGIYTWNDTHTVGGTTMGPLAIRYNIVMNGLDQGIYADGGSNHVTIQGNSIYNCHPSGIYLHDNWNMTVIDNTTYDCGGSVPGGGGLQIYTPGSTYPHTGNIVRGNILVSTAGQFSLHLDPQEVGIASTIFDSNWYARPIDQTTIIRTWRRTPSFLAFLRGVHDWKIYSGMDAHGDSTRITTTDPTKIKWYYNDSTGNKTFTLGAVYWNVKGVVFNNTLTLTPYTSQVLIYDTALSTLPPDVDGGASQNITLPTNSVTLTGTASSPNIGGSIASTLWTKLSGPAATITTPSSLTTTVTGMNQGTYIFQILATDNIGNTATDTTGVIVNDSTVIPPTADAGPDQSITVSTTTLDGSGSTDSDGTITTYAWTKTSGPGATVITHPSDIMPVISNLQTGTYIFHLVVTNNGGATDSDDVQITVNIPPSNSILIITHGNFIFTK